MPVSPALPWPEHAAPGLQQGKQKRLGSGCVSGSVLGEPAGPTCGKGRLGASHATSSLPPVAASVWCPRQHTGPTRDPHSVGFRVPWTDPKGSLWRESVSQSGVALVPTVGTGCHGHTPVAEAHTLASHSTGATRMQSRPRPCPRPRQLLRTWRLQ